MRFTQRDLLFLFFGYILAEVGALITIYIFGSMHLESIIMACGAMTVIMLIVRTQLEEDDKA